jgi:hypothetical protein
MHCARRARDIVLREEKKEEEDELVLMSWS